MNKYAKPQDEAQDAELARQNELLEDRPARRRDNRRYARQSKPRPVSTHGMSGGQFDLTPGYCHDCATPIMIPHIVHRRDLFCVECWPARLKEKRNRLHR